jgi:O-antigen/teichoic acid export membrane protein
MERPSSSSSSRQEASLTRSALWIAAAKMLAFAFGVLLPVLLVRQLSVGEFGHYRQVFLVVNTAVAIMPLGFAMNAYYFFPRRPEEREKVVLNILLFYALVSAAAALAIALRPGMLAGLFNTTDMLRYEPLVALAIFVLVSSSFFETVAIANGEIRLAGTFIVVATFTRVGLMLGAALVFGSVRALLCAAIIQGFIQAAMLAAYLASRFPGCWGWPDWRLLRAQLAYILPLGFSAGVLWWSQMDLHNYFVSNRLGPEVFAVYSVGCLQLPLWGVLLESVGSVMIPAVSSLQSRNDRRQIVVLTAAMMRKLALVCFPVLFFLLVSGRDFIVILFTERYLDAWPVFAIALALLPLSLISTAYDPVFRAYPEHLAFLMKTRLALLAPFLAGLWLATGRFGGVGAISAVVVVNLLERAIVAGKVARILEMSRRDLPLFRDLGRVALAAAIAAVLAAGVHGVTGPTHAFVSIAACGTVFAAIYALGLHVLGALTQEERLAIRSRLSRLPGISPRPLP